VIDFPTPPEVGEEARVSGALGVRYEDVTQDGRLILTVMSAMLGRIVWQSLMQREEVAALSGEGVLPILTRCIFEGTAGPFAQQVPMQADGRYALAHGVDDAGQVNRIFLNMWLEAKAPAGTTWSPPEPSAPAIVAGRLFAEHVFTRPFAAPGERKVLRLDAPNVPAVPPERYRAPPVAELMALPKDARALSEGPVESAPFVFSMMHTDSNQHVNSLAYPRLFEEAAVTALASLGRDPCLLARHCEVRYRKPMFAGDRAHIVLRPYELDGRLFVAGGFLVDGESVPRTTCRIALE
jgi:acyl-CoA thioesterase FadM